MVSSNDPTIAALAEQLDRARTDTHGIDPPASLAALSLEQAYDVQDALVAGRCAGGARQSGWKLGITSPVKQRVMGIASPLFGRTFAQGEHSGGARIPHATLIAPRTEPELAFGLSSPIDDSMDAAALMNAVAWIAPALEVTDSRYRSGTRTAVELVADNTSAAAYVIGARVAPSAAPPIDSFATELVRNGVVVANGSTADVLGNPVNALAALAIHLASRGLRTRSGDIVLSGAITDAVPVAAGDVFEARLAGLGIVTVTFV
jgi:2-keto-4-pentenoate hydratase